jgi:uncharacterized membrane protein YeiH
MPFSVALPNLATHAPLWLALFTVGTNAFVGALRGYGDETFHWDIIGISAFALMMGLGGGFIRDLLLGNLPPESLRSPWYLVAVGAAVVAVHLVGHRLSSIERAVGLLDGLALGLFAVTGTAYALEHKLPAVSAILVGSASAVGGGVAVSVLQGKVARIFVASELHAVLAVFGSALFAVLWPWSQSVGAIVAVAGVILAQAFSRHLDLRTRATHAPGRPPD